MDPEGYFSVQMYESVDELVPCFCENEYIKFFPLKPVFIEEDYPEWDGGMDPEIEDEIVELEDSMGIDYYEDICTFTEEHSMHKVGGYPAYIQGGDWDKRFEFIFQITSDEKVGLNIVDSGNFYFFYSKELDKWELQCDFY